MKTIHDVLRELNILRNNGDYNSFGVFYQSVSNKSNHHYVIVRSEQEFNQLKNSYREYDFKFNKLGV